MTDNEIIKSLEEMAEYPHYYEEGQILKNVLDLIARKQAEIERLKNENMAKEAEYNDMLEQRNSVERYIETAKFDYDTSVAIMRYINNLVEETEDNK